MQITQSLHRAVQAVPHEVCTVFGERKRTFAEVADRVARFAGALQRLGVGDGERVGIYALNSDRYHEFLLAVPWAGGVVNPVNVRWSPAEVAYSLVDCQTEILLVDDAFIGTIAEVREKAPALRTVIHMGEHAAPDGVLDYEELISGTEPVEDVRRRDRDLYGIYYTGGTTGAPKGVMLDHRAMLTSAMGSSISAGTVALRGVLLHAAPMFHLADGAAGNQANLTLSTHVMVPSFTPAGVIEAIQEHGVTNLFLVPTMIQMLLDAPESASADFSTVEQVLYGASPMSETLLRRAQDVFANAGFIQAYGMTELAPVATVMSPADHGRPELARSCGRAAAHSEVRVVDPDDTELPPGDVGEIVARGDHVMQGYWNKPQETEAALRGGWMHTGDMGYMNEDGYFFVVDRLKDMIITGGENVYSVEVENVLAKIPQVESVAVVGAPDEEWGERVHAFVILREGETLTLEEVQAFCKEHIANYKIPRSMEIVPVFPLSGAGKILKRDLRKELWDDAGRSVN
ncbi:long-chain-fatty-acid--CoA ligase [Brevibacterium sp.]|uniref:long-chain-fatty-acid--CoA ligase n=1 Tax=Brevibacterium sp. TaxID=1701 RepID=UPI0025B7E6B3|nr:long-chain-fatty-acid--CoA ligase [Brevibacterium sp.]